MIDLLIQAKKGSLKHESNTNESTGDGFSTVEESAVGKRTVNRSKYGNDCMMNAITSDVKNRTCISNCVNNCPRFVQIGATTNWLLKL